jgi:hypothetical protein
MNDLDVVAETALAMAQSEISRATEAAGLKLSVASVLANRSKGWGTKLLKGERDLTVRDMARIIGACGFEIRFAIVPVPPAVAAVTPEQPTFEELVKRAGPLPMTAMATSGAVVTPEPTRVIDTKGRQWESRSTARRYAAMHGEEPPTFPPAAPPAGTAPAPDELKAKRLERTDGSYMEESLADPRFRRVFNEEAARLDAAGGTAPTGEPGACSCRLAGELAEERRKLSICEQDLETARADHAAQLLLVETERDRLAGELAEARAEVRWWQDKHAAAQFRASASEDALAASRSAPLPPGRPCGACSGTGFKDARRKTRRCKRCGGTGRAPEASNPMKETGPR